MEFQREPSRIFAMGAGGGLVAEITFPSIRKGVVNIDHTFVDDSLRGQGIAAQLAEAAARQIRGEGRRAVVTCAYAAKWFAQHEEYADLLVTTE